MGYALAAAARDFGAEVTLVSGPVSLDPVPGCQVVPVSTAAEMLSAVEAALPGHEILIMAAAVADFQPAAPVETKIERSGKSRLISLEPTPDIIKTVRDRYPGILVAFSLQAGDDLAPARRKLRAKGADYLVVNRYDEPGAGFETDTNHAWILSSSGDEVELANDTKQAIAKKVLEYLIQHMN